jgi:hypothetical protein
VRANEIFFGSPGRENIFRGNEPLLPGGSEIAEELPWPVSLFCRAAVKASCPFGYHLQSGRDEFPNAVVSNAGI